MSEETKDINREEATEGSPVAEPSEESAAVETLVSIFGEEPSEPPRKKTKKISLVAFLCSAVALVLAAVMVTYTCCYLAFQKKAADLAAGTLTPGQTTEDVGSFAYPFELFDAFFARYSMEDIDKDAMLEAALKAYVYATGDRYAAYYTGEELEELTASSEGSSEGIGINIIQDETEISGVTYKVLRVVNIMEGSPALAAGMQMGDMIYAVGIGENAETISSIGYDMALNKLQGKAGTKAEFEVLRLTENGVEAVPFTIDRAQVTTTSVKGEALTWNNRKVGVVKIFQFDLTTPDQFKTEMNRLIDEGCVSFVYDVRNNPGGDLRSIEAVLSYFLKKDDTIIITKDASGAEEISRVKAVTYSDKTYAGCSVKEEEISMYRDYPCAVLCNENTASAGELFTATFRDYGLGTLIGNTTFGKGTMQQTFYLFYYGLPGALKLTTATYYPASGEGYDGMGIQPDQVVEASDELKKLTLYEIDPEKDNQLVLALDRVSGS